MMKTLIETILDVDKVLGDTDISVARQNLLIPELQETFKYDLKNNEITVERDVLSIKGCIYIYENCEKFFEILKKYKIGKLVLQVMSQFRCKSDLKIDGLDIECGTALEIIGENIEFKNVRIKCDTLKLTAHNKLDVKRSELDSLRLYIQAAKEGKAKFPGTKINIKRLFVYSSDDKMIDHLKNLGVTTNYTIDWYLNEDIKAEPLEEFGFNPNQWSSVDRFVFTAVTKELFGIKTSKKFQFGWARNSEYFYPRRSGQAKCRFSNWDENRLLRDEPLV